MFNVFRMHMYRVSRSRSTYILAGLMFVFLLLTFGLAFIIFDDPLGLNVTQAFMTANGSAATISPAVLHRFFIQSNDSVIILLTIFGVLLTYSDFSKGFVKNTYSMFEHKSKLVLAKWGALVACVTVTYVALSLLGLGLGALLRSFEPGEWDAYLRSVSYRCSHWSL